MSKRGVQEPTLLRGEHCLEKSTVLKKGDWITLRCHKSWRKIHPNAKLSLSLKKLQKKKLNMKIQNNYN